MVIFICLLISIIKIFSLSPNSNIKNKVNPYLLKTNNNSYHTKILSKLIYIQKMLQHPHTHPLTENSNIYPPIYTALKKTSFDYNYNTDSQTYILIWKELPLSFLEETETDNKKTLAQWLEYLKVCDYQINSFQSLKNDDCVNLIFETTSQEKTEKLLSLIIEYLLNLSSDEINWKEHEKTSLYLQTQVNREIPVEKINTKELNAIQNLIENPVITITHKEEKGYIENFFVTGNTPGQPTQPRFKPLLGRKDIGQPAITTYLFRLNPQGPSSTEFNQWAHQTLGIRKTQGENDFLILETQEQVNKITICLQFIYLLQHINLPHTWPIDIHKYKNSPIWKKTEPRIIFLLDQLSEQISELQLPKKHQPILSKEFLWPIFRQVSSQHKIITFYQHEYTPKTLISIDTVLLQKSDYLNKEDIHTLTLLLKQLGYNLKITSKAIYIEIHDNLLSDEIEDKTFSLEKTPKELLFNFCHAFLHPLLYLLQTKKINKSILKHLLSNHLQPLEYYIMSRKTLSNNSYQGLVEYFPLFEDLIQVPHEVSLDEEQLFQKEWNQQNNLLTDRSNEHLKHLLPNSSAHLTMYQKNEFFFIRLSKDLPFNPQTNLIFESLCKKENLQYSTEPSHICIYSNNSSQAYLACLILQLTEYLDETTTINKERLLQDLLDNNPKRQIHCYYQEEVQPAPFIHFLLNQVINPSSDPHEVAISNKLKECYLLETEVFCNAILYFQHFKNMKNLNESLENARLSLIETPPSINFKDQSITFTFGQPHGSFSRDFIDFIFFHTDINKIELHTNPDTYDKKDKLICTFSLKNNPNQSLWPFHLFILKDPFSCEFDLWIKLTHNDFSQNSEFSYKDEKRIDPKKWNTFLANTIQTIDTNYFVQNDTEDKLSNDSIKENRDFFNQEMQILNEVIQQHPLLQCVDPHFIQTCILNPNQTSDYYTEMTIIPSFLPPSVHHLLTQKWGSKERSSGSSTLFEGSMNIYICQIFIKFACLLKIFNSENELLPLLKMNILSPESFINKIQENNPLFFEQYQCLLPLLKQQYQLCIKFLLNQNFDSIKNWKIDKNLSLKQVKHLNPSFILIEPHQANNTIFSENIQQTRQRIQTIITHDPLENTIIWSDTKNSQYLIQTDTLPLHVSTTIFQYLPQESIDFKQSNQGSFILVNGTENLRKTIFILITSTLLRFIDGKLLKRLAYIAPSQYESMKFYNTFFDYLNKKGEDLTSFPKTELRQVKRIPQQGEVLAKEVQYLYQQCELIFKNQLFPTANLFTLKLRKRVNKSLLISA